MKISQLKLTILFFLFVIKGFSQIDSVPKKESYFKFYYDNDFFSQTDRYYTQGTRPEMIMPVFKYSPISKMLIRTKKTARNYYGIAMQQDGFTPKSIRHQGGIFYGERPYASICYLVNFLISIDKEKKLRLTTALDLGLIGPNGKGEEEQKAIHKALVNIQPLGWEYQIANDYLINYDLLLEKGLLVKKHLEIMGLTGFRMGTLYTDASGGLLIRAGWMNSYFENLGMFKHSEHKKAFRCTLYARGEAKAVGYNATMQGGFFFRNSIYTIPDKDIARGVAIVSGGIILSYKRLSIEYGKVYITPEFRKGIDHGWGHVVVSTSF